MENESETKSLFEFKQFLQTQYQKMIIPEGTEFCPLIYSECPRKNIDTNCFLTKAPGCPEYLKYLEKENTPQRTYSETKLECSLSN